MKKIASPVELQAELRSIMAFIHASEKPDRQVIAQKLRDLANRTANWRDQAEKDAKKLYGYLKKHGWMSKDDICDDMDWDESKLQLALTDGGIDFKEGRKHGVPAVWV
jgi:hypothetical protein